MWFLNNSYSYAPLAPNGDVPNVDSISFVSWESTDDVPAKFVEPLTLIIKSPLPKLPVNVEPLKPVVNVFLSLGNKIPTDAEDSKTAEYENEADTICALATLAADCDT